MRLHRYWLIVSAFMIGCVSDRLAGTEVGNPELTVSARFAIQGTGDSMTVSEMNLTCMGMEFHTMADSTGMLWEIPTGYGIDLADTLDSDTLKTLKLRTGSWARAAMMLKSQTGDASLPEAVSFQNFSNRRYVKMTKRMGAEMTRFLFEMPRDMEMKLMYDKAHIGSWLRKDTLAIQILFDAGKWAGGLTLEPSAKIRKDGLGADYMLLSPLENAKTYDRLKSMLPKGFMADSTAMF
jgi:hypothetical protein